MIVNSKLHFFPNLQIILHIQRERHCNNFNQAATIRLQVARGNHFLVRATMIYIILAWTGKYKSEVSLHNLITQVTNLNNHILISYKPSTYSDFLTLHILCCYWGMFGQACFMAKLTRSHNQEKRKLLQPVTLSQAVYFMKERQFFVVGN